MFLMALRYLEKNLSFTELSVLILYNLIPSREFARYFRPAIPQYIVQIKQYGFFGLGPLLPVDLGVEVINISLSANLGCFIENFELKCEDFIDLGPALEPAVKMELQ